MGGAHCSANLALLALAGSVSGGGIASQLQPFGLKVAHFTETGRGLQTTRSRAAGESLLTVPADRVYFAETAAAAHPLIAQAVQASAEADERLSDEDVLSLFLVLERRQIELAAPAALVSVSTREYVAGLMSSTPSSPLTMPRHELALLPRTYAAVAECAMRFGSTCHASCLRALERCSSDSAASDLAAELDEASFLWAFSHVRARSVQVEDAIEAAQLPRSAAIRNGGGDKRRALFPGLDLINHRSGARSQLVFRRSTREWAVESGDAYAPGDQVWLDYGERDNLKQLMQYGFCEGATNPVQAVFFDCRDLVNGFACQLPEVLSAPVTEMLIGQLEAAGSADSRTTGVDGDPPTPTRDGGVASADTPLFGLDARSGHAHQSLGAALGMMDDLCEALGAAADEARERRAMEQMLLRRREELAAKLELQQSAAVSASTEAATSMVAPSLRGGIGALLEGEAASVECALHLVQGA